MTLKEEITNYPKLIINGKISTGILTSKLFKESNIKKNIITNTAFLSTNSISQRIWHIIHNELIVSCKNCSNTVNFISFKDGYREFCSLKCVANSKDVLKRKQETSLKRFGSEHPSRSKEIQTKIRNTKLEKYGEHQEIITKKTKSTKLERYGSENYNNKEQMFLTNINRYGDTNYRNTTKFKEKAKETKLKKYGNENFNNRDEASKTKLERYGDEKYNNLEKAKKTNLERYGVEYTLQDINFRKRISKSVTKNSREKYNRDHFTQKHISKNTYYKLNDKEWMLLQHHVYKKSLRQITDELGDLNNSSVGDFYRKHNIEVIYHFSSYPEHILAETIQETYNTEVIRNSRKIIKPYEIDIYLPEYNLAIEYNGIYWHRPENYGSKEEWFKYHQNKIDLCNEKGIRLLHLWEDYGDHNTLLDNAISSIIDNNLELIYEEIYESTNFLAG